MKSRLRKISAVVIAGALAILTSVSLTPNSFAEAAETQGNVITVGDGGEINVVNLLHIADGTTVPNISYTYTTSSVIKSQAEATVDVPESEATKKIKYSSSDTIKNDMVSKNAVIDLSTEKITYPSAGVYEFLIEESCDESEIEVTADSVSVNLDQESDAQAYLVSVYVKNTSNGLKIYGVTVQAYDKSSGEVSGSKIAEVIFEETYVKVLSTLTSLSVDKTVKGDYADLTKKFDYTVTFKNPSTTASQTIDISIGRSDGTSETDSITVDGTTAKTYTFKLGNYDYVNFLNIYSGTVYTLEETAVDGYTASYTQVVGGTEKDSVTATKVDDTVLSDGGTNSVSYINSYKDITVTGVVMNNAPFMVMISLAGVAFVAFVVIGFKRKRNRR